MIGEVLDLKYRHIYQQSTCDAHITFIAKQGNLFPQPDARYSMRISVHIDGAWSDHQARKTARIAVREHFPDVTDLVVSIKCIASRRYTAIVSGLCNTE